MLNFIGKLALYDPNDKMILEYMRSLQMHYRDWVWYFINRVGDDATLVLRAH